MWINNKSDASCPASTSGVRPLSPRSEFSMPSRTRSLFRYPGSKSRLAAFVAKAIRLNGLRGVLFIEPFCGGASASIALLEEGVVQRVVLNDRDEGVAALWRAVFDPEHAEWLADQVRTVPLTLAEWDRQKRLSPSNLRDAALRALYLNRTSFNGILQTRGGPIGGRSQQNRTLGVRFNRDWLAGRIFKLSLLHEQVVEVACEPWQIFMRRYSAQENATIYLDPPFYHKAERLYVHCFDASEHQALRDYLIACKTPWLLSYDDAPEIRELYGNRNLNCRVIDSTYSTHPIGGGSYVGRELLYTNLLRLPAPAPTGAEHEGLTVRNGHGDKKKSNRLSGPVRRPHSVAVAQHRSLC